MVPLLLAAVLALTAVAVADRVEQSLTVPVPVDAADLPAPALDGVVADETSPAAPAAGPTDDPTPLTSAALPAGEMVLTFADGSAAISTGADDPIFELGTTTIGDLDLAGVEPMLAEGDGEVSADWGDVTEWYRAAGDGIEHGYTVDAPVSTGDELTVTVDVTAGEPTLVDSQNVAVERADGSTVWYRGLFAFDANGTDLAAEMAVVDGDIELQIDTTGAEYPITIDPIIDASQKLLAGPDAAGDRFGESVAIDGVPGDMTIVVGAVGADGGQGAAYVFRDEGFGWFQAAKLLPPTPGDRQFGWDVDVRGDVVVVGAPGDDANGADAGAVYVFETAGEFEPWLQTSVVYQCDPSVVSPCGETASGTGFDGAAFGFSVDLTDQFLLVGAPGFQSSAGGAWVYQRSGNDWQTSTAGVLGRTDLPAAGDEFGYAVAGADAGTHIVVGAPGDDNFIGVDAGRTFYSQWDGSALSAPVLLTSGNLADGNTGASVEVELDAQGDVWMFSAQPVNTRFEDGTEPGDSFAWRNVLPAGPPDPGVLISYGAFPNFPALTAFSGTHVLHGDPLADGSGTDSGRALFRTVLPDEPPAYNQLDSGTNVSLPANAGDRWGFDVAATGDTYVIGGPGNDSAGSDAGEVRIGSFSDPGFEAVLSPDPSFDPARLGTVVVVDGNRMVASAPFESTGAFGAGVVYVYERANASAPWVLTATIASPDPEFNGGFGDALDLNGPLLAIGESDRFGDVAEPGRVWVYAFTGGSWELQGPALAPAIAGAANGDQFGASLAWIDETVLAIGAPGASGSTGRVALVNDTGAGWNITEVNTPPGVAPVSGDQFGFDVAAGNGDVSGTNLFVGAPGRDDGGPEGGVVYRFSVVEGVATWTNSFGYVAGGRVGTSVDTFGDTAVAAGYGGGTLTVQILEYIPNPDPLDTDRPFVWNGDGVVSGGVGFIPADGPINDYVALEGTTIAVGRPGGGGSVAVFERGPSGWPTVPGVEVVPAGRRPGDRIGHAVALDGTTLIVGAPGDSGVTLEFPDSGAVYAVEIDQPASGEITGVVLDPGGTPVEGASVVLGSLGVSVLTGVDGSFALTGLPTGDYELSVVPPPGSGLAIEYYPDSFDLANAVPVSTTAGVPLTINLNQVGTVSGVLTDALGAPLEGVDLFTPQFVPGVGWVQDGPAGVTGAAGVYSLELAPGRWAVCARPEVGSGLLEDCVPDGWTTNTPEADGLLVTEGGSIADADLQFRIDDRALINVTLLDELGNPATGNLRVLAACTPPANPVLSTALCSSGPSASPAQFSPPAPFDQFSVRLPAGAYNVAAIVSSDGGASGQISGQTSFTVADGEEFDCTFTMGNGPADCVALTPRFVGGASQVWNDAANWSDGKVPGPDAQVVIPDGVGQVQIDSSVSVASVRVEGQLNVLESGSLALTGGASVNEGSSVAPGGSFIVSGPIDAVAGLVNDGTVFANGATFGAAGNGTFVNRNEFLAGPPPGGSIDIDIPWESSASSLVDVLPNRDVRFAASYVELGRVVVRPGADLQFLGDVTFGASSVIRVEVIGASSPANFGRIAVAGVLVVGPGATLDADPTPYAPTIFDRYTVVDCGSSACEPFTSTQIGPFAQTVVDGDLVLALPTDTPTFINPTAGAVWGNPANWSTGVVPGPTDAAIIPAGTDVTVSGTGTTSIGALTLAGTLRLDTTGSGRTFEIRDDSVVEAGGLLDVTGAIDEAAGVPGTATLNTLAVRADLQIDGQLSVGTNSIAVGAPGSTIEVESAGRLVFTGVDAQTVTGAGQLLNGGTVRNENTQSVTIDGTVDYVDGGGSRIEAAVGEFQFGPADLGLTTVDVEDGATFAFTSASATAGGNFEVRGTLESQSLGLSGIVQVRAGGLFVPAGTLGIESGQVVTAELAPRGQIQLLDGASITGTGLVANSGDVAITGAVTIGSGVTWNSGRNSLVVVDGTLDVQTTNFDPQGSISVESGTITFAGNTILRPSSSLTFAVTSDGSAATINTQQLGFEPFADGDPDQTLARIELDLVDGIAPAGPITVIECSDCAADPPGLANGVQFDEFVTGDYDVIVGRETVDVAILDNKTVGPAPDETFFSASAFGFAVDVDGDWAVVGAPTDFSNFHVLQRQPGGTWEIAQSIETERFLDGTSVAIGGDHLAIGSPSGVDVYRRNSPGELFDGVVFLEGAVLDLAIDGDKLVVASSGDGERVVDVLQLSPTAPPALLGTLDASFNLGLVGFGDSVAVDDRGDGSSTVVVGARLTDDAEGPDTGVVYVYEAVDGEWSSNPAPVAELEATEGSAEFGSSLGVSGGVVVVGDPLNGTPSGDQGAVWVYDETASFGAPPIKLLASDGGPSDTFGIDVDIDGDVIVAGAGAAQKFNFPLRDGAAYVFQFDGVDWVETDQLRAVDGFDQERFGDAVAVSGTNVLIGARRDRNSNGSEAGAVYDFEIEPFEPVVDTTLELTLSSASPGSESVVGSISIAELDRVASAGTRAGSTLAAASLVDIAGDDPQATALSQISLGATPLTSIVIGSDELSAIPLVNIDIDGGWGNVIAGSELENEPFASLTFGQVVRAAGIGNSPQAPDPDSPAGRLAQTPLTSIEVDGTPLTSIPLGAIALGETPLTSIDGPDWCVIVAELIPEGVSCESALAELTLFEVTLRGVPLTSIPLTSIPLTSIDLAESPLTSIPLTSIDLGATPLTSIPLTSIDVAGSPLTSIPLTSIPLTSIPLTSIPLTSIPLTSIPLTSIPLTSIATSIPLTSIPLTSIGPNGTPLTSIQLQGAPLTSIPLTSIVLADTPLTSIPLTSIGNDDAWCDVLAAAGTGFDCEAGADPATTTLRDLSVRGVPLTSIPLTSIPLTSIQLQGAPLTSIPLTSIPLTSIPLTSIPLTSIPLTSIDLAGAPLTSIPLTSIPLTSIDLGATPLTSIPLTSIPLTSIPLTSIPLTSIPLTSIPLTSIPLTSITVGSTPLTSIPLTSIDIVNTPLTSIPLTSIPLTSIDCRAVDCSRDTLGDAARAGAISDAVRLADILGATSGIRLGEIVDALAGIDRSEIIAALAAEGLTLADLIGFDDLKLGELPLDRLGGVTLGDLGAALATVTFGDLIGAIVDPATGQPFPQLEEDLRAGIAREASTLGDLDSLGDVTLGDLLDGATAQLTLADIEPVLGFITVQTFVDAGVIDLDQIDFGTAVLGDLTPDQLGQLTLGDVLDQAGGDLGPLLDALDAELARYTLGDLLLALVDPGSLSLGGVDFPDVAAATLPDGTSPTTSFVARFTATGEGPQVVEVRSELPAGASLRPGTARLIEDPDVTGPRIETPLEPTVSGGSLIWTVTALPGVPYAIEFDVTLGLRLGVASLTSSAQVLGTDVVRTASTELSIIEGAENNDFPQVTPAAEGFVYLTYIASSTDNDVYSITLEENDRLFVELSNLDADLDLALYVDPLDVLSGLPLTGGVSPDAPLNAVTDPDADGADAEPLDDFRRLDQVDDDLELIAVSNQPGDQDEGLATGRLAAGTYYIQVYGANGATNLRPAALQLQVAEADDAPVCQPVGSLPSASFGTLPTIGTDVNTLILVNESRLEQFYGAAARSDVSTALAGLTSFLADDPTIVPAVVPVDGSAAVRAAYQAWDDDGSCDPEIVNNVVRTINEEVIDDVRDQLDHVVILGGDEIIPMARLVDSTTVANEYDFRNEFDGDLVGDDDAERNGRNALTSSFWESRILSDEPYGDADARSLGNRYLYVTDIALGRVVETPDDIVDALDTFVEFDGNLAIETATVLGYDFLVDGSEAVADALVDGLGDPTLVDAALADGIDDTGQLWDRVDAAEKLVEAGTNALVSLNAHFDHYRALPAIGDKVPGFEDNLIAEDVATELADRLGERALLNSLIFSMGCHSGLSVSDISIAGTNTDWAETLGQQGALYVGNTGFGYGDTETVAYTELLMALFAQQVTAPFDLDGGPALDVSTVGQALAWAKNEYVSGLQTFSVYDEKAVMESTFYGLPFYRVGLESEELPAPPDNQVQNGQLVVNIDTDFAEPEETPSGTLFVDTLAGKDSLIVAPGRPIQPKAVVDVSDVDPVDPRRLATVAHGAIIESMTSEYDIGVDPVIASPIFDESASQPEPNVGDVVFPTRPLDITTSVGPVGRRQQLVVATGQYSSERSTQRLDDDHRISVYYSNSPDFTPPSIGAVTSSIAAGDLNIDVSVSDSESSVDRVVALVAQNPGFGTVTWTALPLTDASGRWSGNLTLEPQTTDVEFIIQALDGAGNVGFASNKAENFGDVAAGGGPVTPPTGDELDVQVPPVTGPVPGVFAGSVSITVNSSAPTVEYSVNGGPLVPIGSGQSFTLDQPGLNVWRVVTSSGQTAVGSVEIDTDGAPDIEIRTPADNAATFPVDTPVRFDAICRDDTRERCALTLTGPIVDGSGPARSVTNGSTLPRTPGAYILSVRGTDRLGNEATAMRSFTIAPTVGAPTITAITGPTEPQRIDVPVEIVTTFIDPSGTGDDYELIVDWGDETAPELIAVAPGSEPTSSRAATVPASHLYSGPGVYSIKLTVRDDAGGEAVGTYEFVVVFDPTTRGRVSGQGFYWSGPEAHAGTPWFGSPAFFGYNARYRSGADVPSGKTKLRLVGEFFFQSTQYDYLIVNDTLAVAEGTGTTGGETSYRFRVQGIDNGRVDFFQITIWDDSTGDVLYDNGVVYTDEGLVGDSRGDRVLLGGIRVRS